jgi:phenylacetate-CoA ligase
MDHPLPAARTFYPRHDPARARSIAQDMLSRERWPRARLLEYQQEKLRAIMEHAVANSPYYGELLGDVPSGHITLAGVPTLTKQTLMKEWNRIVTDPHLRLADAERHMASAHAAEPLFGRYQVVASGGTTGIQGVALYDAPAWEIAMAAFQRALATQEISPSQRVMGIGSPSPLHMTRRLFGALRAGKTDVPSLSVTTPFPEVVATLNAFQPDIVITYPSYIRRLAEEQQAGRLRIAPRRFSSTAETLTPDVREIARDTWNATVLNVYGATEVNLMGTECPWTRGAHVPEDLIVLEVVDEHNRPVPPGVLGHKILVTTLYNRAFPLIRYEFSDLLSVAHGTCRCGLPHMRLESIQGRREDVLKLPARDGGHVSVHAVHFHALLVRVPAIRQFELMSRPQDLLIRVALKRTHGADEALQETQRAIESELDRLGASAQVVLEPVDEIARSGTGAKQKLVRASA